MKWREQHEAFKQLVIRQGICQLEQLRDALPFGCLVPQARIDKWMNRILEVPTEFSTQRRYVNRFKLGADPEFVFALGGERIDARNLRLQQGLAFGADNNGRLTEIRPYPSRSALNVVASILSTLRWLAILWPETMKYEWHAGAFLFGDGIGGHVHFGRKRPGRGTEVKALDVLEEELLAVKAYPIHEVLRRRQGDGHQQRYGMPGDIRPQVHGYEYRTFPSWLDSPELAFLTITLSKLVVLNPTLAQGYIPLKTYDQHYQRMRNLLAYFKDTDDDARLALCIIAKKFPTHIGGDFRKRWGIDASLKHELPKISFIPSSIKPDKDTIAEVFTCLSTGRLLSNRTPVPTWSPLVPPDDYQMTIQNTNTVGAKGLGELLWDVCNHRTMPYPIVNNRELKNSVFFSIPRELASSLPAGWRKVFGNKIVVHDLDKFIYSSEKSREVATLNICRTLLLETVLPFWRISEVKPDSYQQWRSTLCEKTKSRFAGCVLTGDLSSFGMKQFL